MSYKDITNGTKRAKAVKARIIEAKTGTVGVEVAFTFEEPTTKTKENLTWVGWCSKQALENTMRTLVDTLGYNGDESTDSNGVFTDPQVLDWNREVDIVVEHETNPENNKSYPKIKWVNKVGGSAFEGCAPETVKSDLAAIGFRAAFLSAKAAMGKPAPKPQPTTADLPF